jgi:hypothetical protein
MLSSTLPKKGSSSLPPRPDKKRNNLQISLSEPITPSPIVSPFSPLSPKDEMSSLTLSFRLFKPSDPVSIPKFRRLSPSAYEHMATVHAEMEDKTPDQTQSDPVQTVEQVERRHREPQPVSHGIKMTPFTASFVPELDDLNFSIGTSSRSPSPSSSSPKDKKGKSKGRSMFSSSPNALPPLSLSHEHSMFQYHRMQIEEDEQATSLSMGNLKRANSIG